MLAYQRCILIKDTKCQSWILRCIIVLVIDPGILVPYCEPYQRNAYVLRSQR